MPSAALRPCAQVGCSKLVVKGRCEQHTQSRPVHVDAVQQADRRNRKKFYDTARWRRLRAMVLARDPVCRTCMRAPSSQADHIIPRERGGADALSNLQGLCGPCHARKTARSDGGFGRAPSARSKTPLGSTRNA